MYWPKSEGRRFVDFDLGGGAQNSSRRNTAGGSARQSVSLQDGEARDDALGEVCSRRHVEVQQKRDVAICSLFSLSGGGVASCEELRLEPKDKCTFVDTKVEAKKHRTEWCVAASKYRCMRCVRNSKKMKMPGICEGPEWLGEDFNHKLEIWTW